MDRHELYERALEVVRQRMECGQAAQLLTSEEMRSVLQDISVYQAELEMQNDELLQTQRRLNESGELHRAVFRHSPVGYAVLDDMLRIREWNDRFATFVNAASRSLVGTPLAEFVHPDDQDAFHFFSKRLASENPEERIELRIVYGAVQPRWVVLRAAMLPLDPPVILAILADIQERKELEMQLVKERNEAERANSAKTVFLTNMSHEIRTPINGIIGMLELLNESPLPAKQAEFVRTARYSAEALLEIVNDVLDLGKIEAGKIELQPEDFDPFSLFRAITESFRPRAVQKGLDFSLRIHGDATEGVTVRQDPAKLRQILNNLISNAVKFTQTGGITLELELLLDIIPCRMKFRVSDTGIGMTPEEQKRVFDRFTQADASTTKRFGGTGLGLTITRDLIRLMNGTIELQSAKGAGTTINCDIPLAGCSNPIGRKVRTSSRTGDLRILIVEDNDISRTVLIRKLEQTGLQCEIAMDGQQAVELCRKRDFDLILMDCQMPVMDGYEATRQIREMPRGSVPMIVAVTAFIMREDVKKCYACGMNGFIPKPVDFHQLDQLIKQLREMKD